MVPKILCQARLFPHFLPSAFSISLRVVPAGFITACLGSARDWVTEQPNTVRKEVKILALVRPEALYL